MTLVYVPRKQIAPSELVSAVLAFVRSIASVYKKMSSGGREGGLGKETNGISYGEQHAEDE